MASALRKVRFMTSAVPAAIGLGSKKLQVL